MLNNKIKLFFAASFSAMLVTVTSCSKIDDFGNLNTNPNGSQQPYTAGLLSNVLSNMGNNYVWDQGGISTVSGLYCQYFSETQYTEASRYAKPTFNWDGYYAGPLKDLQTIIDYNSDPNTALTAATTGPNENQIAIARILKAYIFWFLTSSWGDVPYKGIFNINDNGIVAYTSQQEIYDSLFAELDAAVNQFIVPGKDDQVVQGDILFNPSSAAAQIQLWQKFANSARALMALNLNKVNATLGAQQFNAALNAPGGVFQEGENATLVYPDDNYPNPFYNYYNIVQRDDYAVSDVIVEALAPAAYGFTIDDRLFAYSNNVSSSTLGVAGFPYGLERGAAVAFANQGVTWGRIMGTTTVFLKDGTNFRDVTSPVTILGSAEVYLARAEAAYLGWIDQGTFGTVEDNYYTGIAESWKQWDVYGGELVDAFAPYYPDGIENGEDYFYYISLPEIALDGSSDDYAKIAKQEWIVQYPAGWKGWITWRRTGYPQLSPAPGTNKIPLRYPYGPNEYNLNSANASAAAGNYDGDSQFSPLWWDK